jgi:hypothetical protein
MTKKTFVEYRKLSLKLFTKVGNFEASNLAMVKVQKVNIAVTYTKLECFHLTDVNLGPRI